jgi:hypothetical protein
MTLPGFTAEASLGITREKYARRARGRMGSGRRAVGAQLRGGGFNRGRLGGGLNTIGDYYTCKSACYTAWSSCLDTCEGTIDSPKASRNCLLCDDAYHACLAGCSRDIA